LRDAYAASAKQSILKNLGDVKSFLSQCEILQPERLPSLPKTVRYTVGIATAIEAFRPVITAGRLKEIHLF